MITLTGIMKFFKDDTNTVEKGEMKFRSGFVLELHLTDYTVSAKVRASMKDEVIPLPLELMVRGQILEALCECPRGNWLCSHMAATAIFANKKGLSQD